MHLVLGSRSERGGARRAPTKRVNVKIRNFISEFIKSESFKYGLSLRVFAWFLLPTSDLNNSKAASLLAAGISDGR